MDSDGEMSGWSVLLVRRAENMASARTRWRGKGGWVGGVCGREASAVGLSRRATLTEGGCGRWCGRWCGR